LTVCERQQFCRFHTPVGRFVRADHWSCEDVAAELVVAVTSPRFDVDRNLVVCGKHHEVAGRAILLRGRSWAGRSRAASLMCPGTRLIFAPRAERGSAGKPVVAARWEAARLLAQTDRARAVAGATGKGRTSACRDGSALQGACPARRADRGESSPSVWPPRTRKDWGPRVRQRRAGVLRSDPAVSHVSRRRASRRLELQRRGGLLGALPGMRRWDACPAASTTGTTYREILAEQAARLIEHQPPASRRRTVERDLVSSPSPAKSV
jgi:hypothetical protein